MGFCSDFVSTPKMLFVPESKKWLRGIFPAVFAIFIYLKVPIENQSPDCTHAFQMSETSSPRSRRSMQEEHEFFKAVKIFDLVQDFH